MYAQCTVYDAISTTIYEASLLQRGLAKKKTRPNLFTLQRLQHVAYFQITTIHNTEMDRQDQSQTSPFNGALFPAIFLGSKQR